MPFNISNKPGIYIHIPYCDSKCGYCDFYSITNNIGRDKFIPALKNEISSYIKQIKFNSNFDTIYLGGGTPSLLSIKELDDLFSFIKYNCPIDDNCEVTLEANPGTLDREKLEFYKSIEVNRLSVGIQSFHNSELKRLDRMHSADQARQNVALAQQIGIDNISVDLIFALPGQTIKKWLLNLEQAVSLHPKHISAYNLIFEKGTQFYKRMLNGEITKKSDKEELIFFKATIDFLKQHGLEHYEVSNYATSSRYYSRHNCKYWDHTNYLGFGPSAHSYWNGKRWSNIRSVAKYIENVEFGKSAVDFSENIDQKTEKFETVMLGLRKTSGINLKKYETKYSSVFFNEYPQILDNLINEGLAEICDDHFRLTSKGLMICDEIITGFLPN